MKKQLCSIAAVGLAASTAQAISFSLDDNPMAPIASAPGPLGGLGAEDPFGIGFPPGLAPSPSVVTGLPHSGDGAIFSPGPVLQHAGPNGFYLDSLSSNKIDLGGPFKILFSVDRLAFGLPGSGLFTESIAGQQSADVYESTAAFASPGSLVGSLVGAPFAGLLNPPVVGGSNVLRTDESALGLLAGGAVVPPGVPSAAPLDFATHDNIDAMDTTIFDADGDTLFDADAYFTIYPDEALAVGASPADIFAVAAGDPGAVPVPYAPSALLGLDPGLDSIDALVMFDGGVNRPIPLTPGAAGPGSVEPGVDYALFSLAPGSISLLNFGLGAGDIFFTDFTGAFGVYAAELDLGIIPAPTGPVGGPGNIDALNLVVDDTPPPPGDPIPEPVTAVLGLIALGATGTTLRRRR